MVVAWCGSAVLRSGQGLQEPNSQSRKASCRRCYLGCCGGCEPGCEHPEGEDSPGAWRVVNPFPVRALNAQVFPLRL